MTSSARISGEVIRYVWRNPHVYIFVEGTDESGLTAEWQVEADPTPLMSRSGWTASTLAVGDRVTLVMHPDRDAERRHGLLATLTKADGLTLERRTIRANSNVRAQTIAGVWDALPQFSQATTNQIYDPSRAFTPAGVEAAAAYTDALFPPSECLAFPTPAGMVVPYLYAIEILEDRVIIKGEFYSVERTVYTDGRDHPEDGTRTIQGHSIGHWEDTTLVVDTELFADYRLANGPGVPAGAQKHTVERFQLSADRTQLEIEMRVEDPEYVVEPFTVRTVWDYAPGRRLQQFSCDAENARSFYDY